MPFTHFAEHDSRLVVVRGTGEGSVDEASDCTHRLLEDWSIGDDYRLMFVVDEVALEPTLEDMEAILLLLGALRFRFKSRMAIVSHHPTRTTTSVIVAFIADRRYGNVQYFTVEDAARKWLLAGTPPHR